MQAVGLLRSQLLFGTYLGSWRVYVDAEHTVIGKNGKVLHAKLLCYVRLKARKSRSLGQQVSEAEMTSQLYNVSSPSYTTRHCARLLPLQPRMLTHSGHFPSFSYFFVEYSCI